MPQVGGICIPMGITNDADRVVDSYLIVPCRRNVIHKVRIDLVVVVVDRCITRMRGGIVQRGCGSFGGWDVCPKENLNSAMGVGIQMIFMFPLDKGIAGIERNQFVFV